MKFSGRVNTLSNLSTTTRAVRMWQELYVSLSFSLSLSLSIFLSLSFSLSLSLSLSFFLSHSRIFHSLPLPLSLPLLSPPSTYPTFHPLSLSLSPTPPGSDAFRDHPEMYITQMALQYKLLQQAIVEKGFHLEEFEQVAPGSDYGFGRMRVRRSVVEAHHLASNMARVG